MRTRQSRLPFHPPFFYGWVIIGMSMVSAFLAAGASQLFMGIMLKPISEDLGWTRTMTSGAITAGTLMGGVLAPIMGRLVDRYGARLLMPVGALIVSLGFFFLSGITALWQFYLAYVLARAFATACMGGVVPITTATNWFFQKRGRAIGFIAMSLPLGGAFLALLGHYIISVAGWRTVFLILSVVTTVLVVGPAAMVMRRRPEDVGLLPDGVPAASTATSTPETQRADPSAEYSFTLTEALHTPTLWLLIVSIFLDITANGAVGFHQVAYYTDIGIAAGAAATALSVYGLAGALSSGFWGFVIERVPPRFLAVGVMLLAALAAGLLLLVRNEAMAIGVSALYGFAARGEGPLLNMIIARYYGRDSYGTIIGFTTPFLMVGLGLGPLLGSLIFDATGTYRGAFTVFVFFYLLTAVIMFQARPPRPPERTATQREQEVESAGG